MNANAQNGNNYIGYEYKEMLVEREKVSLVLDAYENFGWLPESADRYFGLDEIRKLPLGKAGGEVRVRLRRDRKIANKMELTRLQRHFDDCLGAINALERAKTTTATILAIVIGIIGTAFMAGSVFAVTAEPPRIALCVLLAIPAITGWVLPYFAFKRMATVKSKEAAVLIDDKYEEIYKICEKGHKLL